MDKIKVSAPGKLMLMGEHSVVYSNPCLVASINKRITVEIAKSDQDFWPNSKFIDSAVKIFRTAKNINQPVKITTASDFTASYGLGSSSAVTAATVYGLHKLFLDQEPDKKELFAFSYLVALEVQGVSSGFDIASAIYGGIIYFLTGGKIIEPILANDLPLLVAYSGTKANTVDIVNQVKQQMTDHEAGVKEIFRNISHLVEEGKKALLEKDWQRLGTLMNFNQDYLSDLGVSTEKLDDMISAAKNSGAYGAKLSGAGEGDCMIAVIPEEKRKEISESITKVGGEILDVKISNEGVKVE